MDDEAKLRFECLRLVGFRPDWKADEIIELATALYEFVSGSGKPSPKLELAA